MSRKKPTKIVHGKAGVPVEIDGVLYANCREAGKAYPEIGGALIGRRHRAGLRGLDLVKPKMHSRAKSIIVNGTTYSALKDAAQALGIGPSTLGNRLAAGDQGERLTRPVGSDSAVSCPVEHEGVRWPSRIAFAKAMAPKANVMWDTIVHRLRAGASPEEAIKPRIRTAKPPEPVAYQGRVFSNRRAFTDFLAKAMGLNPETTYGLWFSIDGPTPEKIVEAAKAKRARSRITEKRQRATLAAELQHVQVGQVRGFQGDQAVPEFVAAVVRETGAAPAWIRSSLRAGMAPARIVALAADPVMTKKELSLPISVFGWRFASGEAAMAYWQARDRVGIRDQVLRARMPLYDLLREAIVILGTAGMLRPDLRRKNERGIKPKALPVNEHAVAIADEAELRALAIVHDTIARIVERDRRIGERIRGAA